MDYNSYEVVVVIQSGNPAVRGIIESMLLNPKIISTQYELGSSARKCINSNMFTGLMYCFRELQSDFVVVIEDDILIATDFLVFCEKMFHTHADDSRFRAVNGFSNIAPSRFEKMIEHGYVRSNYGVGWGWAISRDTFERVKLLWNGDEDEHWDSYIEPVMRTGYVVNPILSRTLNIGFGLKASHTQQSPEIQLVGMRLGFLHLLGNPLATKVPYVRFRKSLPWRSDCVNVDLLNPITRVLLYCAWHTCSLTLRLASSATLKSPKSKVIVGLFLRIARSLTVSLAGIRRQ